MSGRLENKLNILNLQLTSDNRLIDKEYKHQTKIENKKATKLSNNTEITEEPKKYSILTRKMVEKRKENNNNVKVYSCKVHC